MQLAIYEPYGAASAATGALAQTSMIAAMHRNGIFTTPPKKRPAIRGAARKLPRRMMLRKRRRPPTERAVGRSIRQDVLATPGPACYDRNEQETLAVWPASFRGD
ncbi:hypothetical protein GCM10019059_31480 [Camelimonas fluminis]|nr:hypothetical protein GCM10019059_31480 [Camelimonas fluminis]